MKSEKNTSPARLGGVSGLWHTTLNHTPVRQASLANPHSLLSPSTIPVSASRRTPGGLVLLRSMPLASVAPGLTQLRSALPSLTLKPYAHTLELLRQHQNTVRKRERDPHLLLNLAWVSQSGSPVEFNRRVLESFELSLAHTLFLESEHIQQSVEAVCAENHFDAIVVEAPANAVIVKRAQRWLKPIAHDPLKPESANCLETHPRERLFILIDERNHP